MLAVGVAALLAPAAWTTIAGASARPRAVSLDVLAQVVAPHEALVTDRAGEALLPRVGAQVPLQLVGAGEPFAAEEPVADEGPFPGVPAQVGLEVRGLAVDFAAAWDVAAVQTFPPQAGPRGSKSLCLLAVRAVTGGSTGVTPGRGARGPS